MPFGIFKAILVFFSRFGKVYEEKSGNPDHKSPFSGREVLMDCCRHSFAFLFKWAACFSRQNVCAQFFRAE
jgi:hypothetical protein